MDLHHFKNKRSNSRQEDLEWAIGLNRFGMKIVGLWPDAKRTKKGRLLADLCVFVILISSTCFTVIPAAVSLFNVWGDLILIIDNLQLSLPTVSAIVKVSMVWWHREGTSLVVEMITNDWLERKDDIERDTMIKEARMSRMITMVGYFLTVNVLIMLNVLPCFGLSLRYVTNLTDPGKPLPLQSYFFYDLTKQSYFVVTFAFQSFSLISAGICYTVVDSFFGVLVLHVCGQLDNLYRRFVNLRNFTNISEEISKNVGEHERLIKYVNIVENTFNLILLGQLLYFSVLFCFLGVLFINVTNHNDIISTERLLWLVTNFTTVFLHMFIYCFVGEKLLAQGDRIYSAAYNCAWYTMEPKEAKKLILVMRQASIPLYITAGKIFPMTLAMFCNLIKTSAGYISVLLAEN